MDCSMICGGGCGAMGGKPFDIDTFFSYLPEFDNPEAYPTAVIMAAGRNAQFWVSSEDCAWLCGDERKYAQVLMTGHLILMAMKAKNATDPNSAQNGMITSGSVSSVGGSGLLQSASVGGVSVSLQVPQYFKGPWDWWLGQTPYGQNLLAFLDSRAAVGIYGMGDDIRSCLRE